MHPFRFSRREEKQSERSRWTPLTRMLLSGEMTQERQKELSNKEKFDRWMINEGYRRVYVMSCRKLALGGGADGLQVRWRLHGAPRHGVRLRLCQLRSEGQSSNSARHVRRNIRHRQIGRLGSAFRRGAHPPPGLPDIHLPGE